MSDATRTPSFPWGWYIALVVSGVATGLAFATSKPAGFVLIGVTVVILAAFVVWAVRRGRRLQTAGYKPQPRALEQRLRRRAKWITVLTVLSAATAVASVVLDDGHTSTPRWLVLAGPVLLLVGVCILWLLVAHLRRQADKADQAD